MRILFTLIVLALAGCQDFDLSVNHDSIELHTTAATRPAGRQV